MLSLAKSQSMKYCPQSMIEPYRLSLLKKMQWKICKISIKIAFLMINLYIGSKIVNLTFFSSCRFILGELKVTCFISDFCGWLVICWHLGFQYLWSLRWNCRRNNHPVSSQHNPCGQRFHVHHWNSCLCCRIQEQQDIAVCGMRFI